MASKWGQSGVKMASRSLHQETTTTTSAPTIGTAVLQPQFGHTKIPNSGTTKRLSARSIGHRDVDHAIRHCGDGARCSSGSERSMRVKSMSKSLYLYQGARPPPTTHCHHPPTTHDHHHYHHQAGSNRCRSHFFYVHPVRQEVLQA